MSRSNCRPPSPNAAAAFAEHSLHCCTPPSRSSISSGEPPDGPPPSRRRYMCKEHSPSQLLHHLHRQPLFLLLQLLHRKPAHLHIERSVPLARHQHRQTPRL